jgi:LytS/YehU family sensor histidine kinase
MMRDAAAANRMLVRLSDLLRLSLDHVGAEEVSLRQELEFLNGYLEIEQTRFQHRLAVSQEIEPSTLEAAVPNLFLQPVVENAIRHGIAKRLGGGKISIRSRREGGNLLLEVEDDGAGLGSEELEEGLGLSNTRARFQHLYGSRHRFVLKNAPAGGVVATMIIPFRSCESHE